MNTRAIISWGVVALIVVGSAWYVFSNNQSGNGTVSPLATTTPPTSTSTPPQKTGGRSPAPAVKKSNPAPQTVTPTSAKIVGITPVSYLLGLKEPLVCSISTTGSSLQRSGTMYVADGEMRADLASASVIDDGAYLYLWHSGASKGLRLLAASSVSGSAIASNGGFDLATPLSFACNPWTKDASVFVPPASVSFSNTL